MDSTACGPGHEPLTPEPQPATTPENIDALAEQQQQQQDGGPSVSPQRAPWTDNEEEALREGVRTFGEGRWDVVLDTYVARFAAGRTADDLNDKWCSLDREATAREQQTPWTEDEVAALREGVRTFGEGRWEVVLDTYVARFQSGRTADDLEDKWRHTQQEAKEVPTRLRVPRGSCGGRPSQN